MSELELLSGELLSVRGLHLVDAHRIALEFLDPAPTEVSGDRDQFALVLGVAGPAVRDRGVALGEGRGDGLLLEGAAGAAGEENCAENCDYGGTHCECLPC